MYGSSTVQQPILPGMDDSQSPTTTISTSSSAVTSTEVSPAYYQFENPSIDTVLTPLTSVDQTPINEKDEKFVQVGTAAGEVVELEELERRVRESCEGRTSVIEAWGHRGASAAWRECVDGNSIS